MRYRTPPKKRPYIALIGLLIAVVVGVIAWLITPIVLDLLARMLPNFRGDELPLATTRPLFTGLIVLIAVVIFGLVAALRTPKDSTTVSEAQMERERNALWRQQKAERDRQRKPKGKR